MLSAFLMSIAAVAAQAAVATPNPPAAPAAAAAPTATAAVSPDDKIRCKRYTETGSLAHVIKECHTARDWREIEANARRNATRYMDDSAIHSGGGPQ
jgi:hypothetical protein